MQCFECGFEYDEANESQPACPRCGTDPNERPRTVLGTQLLSLGAPTHETKNITPRVPVITPGNTLIN
jgi:hypothetical protein